MGQKTNDKVEFNFEVNYVAISDDITINNDNYSPPPHPPQVFQLKKDRVKKLNAFLMSKVKPKIRNNYEMFVNVKEVIGDSETFSV